jgi:hypothetical protein
MKRGQRPSAEQIVLMSRQIEVQMGQGKGIAVACKEADVSEQSYVTRVYARRSSIR